MQLVQARLAKKQFAALVWQIKMYNIAANWKNHLGFTFPRSPAAESAWISHVDD